MIDVIGSEGFARALETNEFVVACFTEPASCAPCRALAPHFDNADQEMTEMLFVKVDLAKASHEIADEFNISSVPKILFFKDGELVTEITERTGPKIVQKLKTFI